MQYTAEAIKKRNNRKKKIKNIINTTICILLVPLLLNNVLLIMQSIINPDKTPSFFGMKMYVIISGSMKPELEIGDIVIVKETNNYDLQEGDIISFRQGQSIVTHRISEVLITDNKIRYKTKGDNNNIEDTQMISEKEIEGKVIDKIPSLGKIALALKDKTLIIVIIMFYYIYLVKDQSIQKRKNMRKIKRNEYELKKNERKNYEETKR